MTTGWGQRKTPNTQACQEVAERVLSLAMRAGADGVEALVREGAELEVKVRLGEPELVKEASSRGLGLRVLRSGRSAVTYTSDFQEESLLRFVEESVALCHLAEPDELAALPAREEMARMVPDLDLWDESVMAVDVDKAMAMAVAGECAATKSDSRVTNSDGASFGRTVGAVAFASSAGFSGAYRGSHVSLVVEPLCDDDEGKKRSGYYYSSGRFLSDLLPPEVIGRESARRTVAKLGARKVPTCEVATVFSPEAGRSLLAQFAGVISGGAVWRKSTYLLDRDGSQVASPLVSITDDPLIRRAAGSRPFDGEGLPTQPNVVVDRGILRTFLCDVYAGRKLGRRSTGSAARSLGGSPYVSTSNFILAPGTTSTTALEAIEKGLYVTDLMGFGFNPVTGDFSQGAAGFWIEKGERCFPVSEVTLSINFDDLWRRVDAIGDDLDTRSSIRCPSFRVQRITLAGT